MPLCTVVTTTHNGAVWIEAAVASILAQTCRDFEYLLVDDASTDTTPDLLRSVAARDPRIRVLPRARQGGPAVALNDALAEARGEFWAVLDHDDLAHPRRLELQLAFLREQPDIDIVGSRAAVIDDAGRVRGFSRYATHPAAVQWQLLFGSGMLHSSWLARRDRLRRLGGYSAAHATLCDYELLTRVTEHGRIANLPDTLACWRRSDGQQSSRHAGRQLGQMLLLQFALQSRRLGLRPDLASWETLFAWRHGRAPADAARAEAAMASLEQAWRRHVEVTPLEGEGRRAVDRACAQRWLMLAHHAHRPLRAQARACWRRAWELDPDLLADADNRAELRGEIPTTPGW